MKHMIRKSWLPVLIMLFAAQWAVPLAQVYREETIRREGAVFRLPLQPVDPYDVMRGRYLALSFLLPPHPLTPPDGKEEGDAVYAVLQKGDDGMAYIARLSAEPENDAFLTSFDYGFPWQRADAEIESQMHVNIPLTRFYLPEDDAIAVDRILATPAASGSAEERRVQAALDVRVLDGRIVAESLWLDGRPYREWLAGYREAPEK